MHNMKRYFPFVLLLSLIYSCTISPPRFTEIIINGEDVIQRSGSHAVGDTLNIQIEARDYAGGIRLLSILDKIKGQNLVTVLANQTYPNTNRISVEFQLIIQEDSVKVVDGGPLIQGLNYSVKPGDQFNLIFFVEDVNYHYEESVYSFEVTP